MPRVEFNNLVTQADIAARLYDREGVSGTPSACMCHAYDEDGLSHWRPCPPSLCERRSHALAHRLATSARDYRYGGLGAWLRWVVRGIPADWRDDDA